jgi:predicted RNA-binding protein
MRKIIYFLSLMCVLSLSVLAQSVDGIKGNLAVGEVSAINVAENKISLKTKDGAIDAVLSAKTVFKRVLPENPSLSAAVASAITEIAVGDKVLVTGLVADDKKSLPAKAVYLMTKSDISKKQSAEQEKWKTRGISGKVKAVNADTKEITLTIPSFAGEKTTTLTPTEKAVYHRYAENSVNFSDAKPSNFNEIKVGDQVRAVGDKTADGLKMTAEELVTGSFRQVVGKITAIDIAKNEITIKESPTKDNKNGKSTVVVINENVPMKKFPAEMAMMLAMRAGGGTPQGGGVRPPEGTGTGQPATGGQGRGFGGGGSGGFDEMLERLPKITLSDLKVGDTIGTLTSASVTQNRITAIKLLSGVEAFLNAPQIPGGGGGRGGQGGGSGFSIPGLDSGFGF